MDAIGTQRFDALSKCTLLKRAIITNNDADEATHIHIAVCCSALEEINLRYAKRVFAVHCHHLHTIKIEGAGSLSNTSIITIAQHCNTLTNLDISYHKWVNDESMTALVSNKCLQLQTLNLSNTSVSDVGLSTLTINSTSLTFLDLDHTSATHAGIIALVQHTPALVELRIEYCKGVCDETLLAIASQCASLRRLFVSECTKAMKERMLSAHHVRLCSRMHAL